MVYRENHAHTFVKYSIAALTSVGDCSNKNAHITLKLATNLSHSCLNPDIESYPLKKPSLKICISVSTTENVFYDHRTV